eukprot:scaffold6858_cov112-Isochrysis_galbana.AAC.3
MSRHLSSGTSARLVRRRPAPHALVPWLLSPSGLFHFLFTPHAAELVLDDTSLSRGGWAGATAQSVA